MAVVCGVVSVVGRRQAAAVPVGLGEVFYLQWTVRIKYSKRNSVCNGAKTLSRRYSVYNRTGTLNRRYSVYNRTGTLSRRYSEYNMTGTFRQEAFIQFRKGREDWENGGVINLEWGGNTGITVV